MVQVTRAEQEACWMHLYEGCVRNLEVLVQDGLGTPTALGPDAVPCQEGRCGRGQCIIHGHARLHLHPAQQNQIE